MNSGHGWSWKAVVLAVAVAGFVTGPMTVAASGTSSWTIENASSSEAKTAVLLSDVCWRPRACVAVGGSPSGSASALVWNGSKWSVLGTPPGSGQTTLDGVSCSSAKVCTAVGYTSSGRTNATLAEGWDGTAWAVQPTPTLADPSGSYAYLKAVSCRSPKACTAVGYAINKQTSKTLAETWNGSKWTVQATPAPAGSVQSWLNGVSCASAVSCIAVGYYDPSSGSALPLVEQWHGTKWTVQTTPKPRAASGSYLYSVSCSSATACTATGSYLDFTGHAKTLAEAWNGSAWALQATPNPGGALAIDYLTSVSCTSAHACTAVGYYAVSASRQMTLAETWDGSAWRAQPTPNPRTAASSNLVSVSCAGNACAAVGYSSTATTSMMLAEGMRS